MSVNWPMKDTPKLLGLSPLTREGKSGLVLSVLQIRAKLELICLAVKKIEWPIIICYSIYC